MVYEPNLVELKTSVRKSLDYRASFTLYAPVVIRATKH